MYLDYVDFGPRRPPHTLPRISIWKGDMIKTYSDLDLKSPGCYGFFARCWIIAIPVIQR